MPTIDPQPSEVYSEILQGLRKNGAELLAQEIERTVARGVVDTEQATELYQKSSVYRSMSDRESLAVALEFIVTAVEIPMMLRKVHSIVGDNPVKWMPERPGTEREQLSVAPIEEIDATSIDKAAALLTEIINSAKELEVRLPEIA